jgi:putative SOS response-associated peptidase YedK
MCNRYSLKSLDALKAFYEELADCAADDWTPRYNVALTSRMPVITKRAKPTLEAMHFGFKFPARTPGEKPMLLANARAETALAKPGFRDAALHRRCLVPADGFYEWEKSGTTRLPHYFSLKSGRPFFFAGLWEPARDGTPAAFCIVTTTANALLQPIHERIPVMLGPNSGPAWLGDEPVDPVQFARLCRPLSADMMTGHRVDPRMNHVRHEAPDCVAAII